LPASEAAFFPVAILITFLRCYSLVLDGVFKSEIV
jgi:hypothetical protein